MNKCVMNCTIFHGSDKQVNENIANKVFDNFIDAFDWLYVYLDNRDEEFEIEDYFRAGFADAYINLSRWDEQHNYWYTEVYNIEYV